jgi:hypothetical protein
MSNIQQILDRFNRVSDIDSLTLYDNYKGANGPLFEAIDVMKLLYVFFVDEFKESISRSCDIILGFIDSDFGDITFNENVVFKRNDFYKKTIEFNTITGSNDCSGLVRSGKKSIEFWTHPSFPLLNTNVSRAFSIIGLNTQIPVKTVSCLTSNSMWRILNKGDKPVKYHDVVYTNGFCINLPNAKL